MSSAATPGRVAGSGARMIDRVAAREPVLMTLTLASGVVDAVSFLALGKVFTAFMTGNVVFLGLGAAGAFGSRDPNVLRVGVALVSFAIGAFVAARVLKRSGRSRIWPHGFAFALTGVLLAQVVFMVGWMVVSGYPSATFATCLAAISAVGMGMQGATVSSLGLRGVFTTAATGTVTFLAGAAADRPRSLVEPARHAGVLIFLFVGAITGGLLLVNARMYAPVVPPLATALAIAGARMSGERPDPLLPRSER
jgi:uncharacterized membrane protein YoaK (UPF0700 family)